MHLIEISKVKLEDKFRLVVPLLLMILLTTFVCLGYLSYNLSIVKERDVTQSKEYLKKFSAFHLQIALAREENEKLSKRLEELQDEINLKIEHLETTIENKNGVGFVIEHNPSTGEVVISNEQNIEETKFIGIGIGYKKHNDQFIIVEILEGSPAHQAGLYQGDKIIKVDGMPTSAMSTNELSDILRGEKATMVNLAIAPAGTLDVIKEIVVTRDEIDFNKHSKGE